MSKKYASCVTIGPLSDCCCWGEAEVHILDFKTTWSEFQKASQTATEQGKVEQWIFDFKTTWSEFRKTCQTNVARGEAELRIYNLEKTSLPQSRSQAVVCVSTPRVYPCSGSFLVSNKYRAPPNFSTSRVHVIATKKIMIKSQHKWLTLWKKWKILKFPTFGEVSC